MTDKPESHSGPEAPADDITGIAEHFCAPADVETVARRLNLDKRRVQQLAKSWPDAKTTKGEYVCPRMVYRYSQMLQNPKRSRASGLAKRQEESLEIRNARDRAEVLRAWEVLVQRKAVIAEMAPAFVALKNGVRKIPSALCNDIVMFAKRYAQTVQDGTPTPDHELVAQVLKMLSGPIDDSLRACMEGLRAWLDQQDTKTGEDTEPACQTSSTK